MTDDAPTLETLLASLGGNDIVRAATWFGDYCDAYAFAVSFGGAPRSRDGLQDGLVDLTRAALEQALPDYDPAFLGGQLVVDVVEGTISIELARGVTETTEDRLTVDLAAAASLFARPDEAEAEDDPRDSTAWDLEWHAADDALEDPAAELAMLEQVFLDGTGDRGKASEWVGVVESLLDAVEEEEEEEDDEDDELDPDEAIRALGEALAALRATGATTATVRYEAENFGQALADAMNAAAGEIESPRDDPAEVVASTSRAVEELFEESPWDLSRLELDGEVADTEPAASWLRTAAMLVLLARLGDWEEMWSSSGSSGVLELDLPDATATLVHRHPRLRRLPPERIVIRARDGR